MGRQVQASIISIDGTPGPCLIWIGIQLSILAVFEIKARKRLARRQIARNRYCLTPMVDSAFYQSNVTTDLH